MTTLLLYLLPLVAILAAFAYAAATGLRMYRANGHLAALAVAVMIAGLTLGRLADRFSTLPRFVNDWINYRGDSGSPEVTGGDRLLAELSVESALLFLFAAVIAFIAVTIIRRDAAQARSHTRSGGRRLMAALFVAAVAITLRSKIAGLLAFAMARAHLL